jgi:glycosyltransferase involved in cell wall biosynthesis
VKILLVAGVDLALPGGLETHVLELARCLHARGHDVTIEGRPTADTRFRIVPSADPDAFDVVHHHGGSWGRRPTPRSFVRTFHFSVAAKMAVYVRMGRFRTLVNPGNLRALADERRALQRPGVWIAVSESLRRDLGRIYRVDTDRILTIPSGARFDSPREGRIAWRARHGIPISAPVVLTIGREDYVKGFDLMEHVWNICSGQCRGAIWVRVGGRRPERSERRITTGPIPAAEVVEWIHAADIGAFPSYYEGGGIALLDMIGGGLYTATHDVGIASEVVRPGHNGELVPRSRSAWISTLSKLLTSPPGRVSDSLPSEFRWESIAMRVESVYRDIVRPCASSS